MLEQDQLANWIVGLASGDAADEKAEAFIRASQQAWPRVLAHTRRELSNQRLSTAEIVSLALEVWEVVLQSIWKTLGRANGVSEIRDLENYLIGTFHHRLNRELEKVRLRGAILEFLAPEKLAELTGQGCTDTDYSARIDKEIQLKQVYAMMDDCVRRAMVARAYGFSWSEIATTLQVGEHNLIMRVQYAIRKIRAHFAS
jgi:DNA-directed RNA polymerase specialized sigma24 family protein